MGIYDNTRYMVSELEARGQDTTSSKSDISILLVKITTVDVQKCQNKQKSGFLECIQTCAPGSSGTGILRKGFGVSKSMTVPDVQQHTDQRPKRVHWRPWGHTRTCRKVLLSKWRREWDPLSYTTANTD